MQIKLIHYQLVELVRDVDIKIPDIALVLSALAFVIWPLVFTSMLYVIDHLFITRGNNEILNIYIKFRYSDLNI